MSKLKLEVFETDKAIEPVYFYTYKVESTELISNQQQFIRSVTGKISSKTKVPAFTDDRLVYTISKLENLDIDKTFRLSFEKTEKLDIQQNRIIYSKLTEYYIKEQLRLVKFQNQYVKYKIGYDVTTPWIFEINKVLSSDDKQFRLRRKFDFSIKISDDNKLQIWLNIRSEFETKKTIFDYLTENKIIQGMKVFNEWGNKECGIIEAIGPESVSDHIPGFMSLKKYMIQTKQGERIKNCPDNTPVIHVRLNNNKKLCYYPQALKPIVSFERIASENPYFSKQIEKYIKLDMTSRQNISKVFLSDIGNISNLNNVEFIPTYVDAEKVGFMEYKFDCPSIIGKDGAKLNYNKQSMIFSHGFYKQPDNPVKFAYFYPEGKENLMRNFAIEMTNYLIKGNLFGDKRFLVPKLMLSEVKAVCNQAYKLGDPMNYKKLVRSLSEEKKFDIAIVLVPTEEDESNPYSVFKTAWAEKNIPSQMISIKTAEMFQRKDSNAVWFMQNIALGIFSKAGGIPWIIDDVPGNIDCFVGIDVATLDKGIHYPTCATVFDKNGRPISFYKPRNAQKGEKISSNILQEIFDEVILGYEEKTGSSIKNIVIHRDGFSNEDAEWYKNYFDNKQINYTVVEVKKYVSSKLLCDVNGIALNPSCGSALINEDEAFIVTTDIKDGKASPRPLHIKKQVGNLQMKTVVQQILALSCMHFGATKKSRLPVTTYYADKICKNIDYIPEGKFGNNLFFL